MKKFGVIFQYELMNYIKNKSYVITTVIIALVAGIIMFVPNFIDIGSVTGENKNDVSDENSEPTESECENFEEDEEMGMEMSM